MSKDSSGKQNLRLKKGLLRDPKRTQKRYGSTSVANSGQKLAFLLYVRISKIQVLWNSTIRTRQKDQFCNVHTRRRTAVIFLHWIRKPISMELASLCIAAQLVRQKILSLNVNKSCDSDEISPPLLTQLVDFVTDSLISLINAGLKQGILPLDWKKAFVSPIYKKGASNRAENYHPISRTSIADGKAGYRCCPISSS